MADELRFHIEAVTNDLVRRGVPRDEAERRAHVHFGGVERVKDECRQARGVLLIDRLQSEIRYAARRCLHTRGFTSAVVLTLALAIGANASIFAVVYRVVLHPLPYGASDRLVALEFSIPSRNVPTVYYIPRGSTSSTWIARTR